MALLLTPGALYNENGRKY